MQAIFPQILTGAPVPASVETGPALASAPARASDFSRHYAHLAGSVCPVGGEPASLDRADPDSDTPAEGQDASVSEADAGEPDETLEGQAKADRTSGEDASAEVVPLPGMGPADRAAAPSERHRGDGDGPNESLSGPRTGNPASPEAPPDTRGPAPDASGRTGTSSGTSAVSDAPASTPSVGRAVETPAPKSEGQQSPQAILPGPGNAEPMTEGRTAIGTHEGVRGVSGEGRGALRPAGDAHVFGRGRPDRAISPAVPSDAAQANVMRKSGPSAPQRSVKPKPSLSAAAELLSNAQGLSHPTGEAGDGPAEPPALRNDPGMGVSNTPVATVAVHRAEMARFPVAATVDVLVRHPDRAVEISLRPEELGHVRMSLSMTDAGMTLVISAERPETLDLMRRHIDQLAQEFRRLGYDTIGFAFGGDHPGTNPHNDRQNVAPSRSLAELDESAVPEAAARAMGSAGLDLRL